MAITSVSVANPADALATFCLEIAAECDSEFVDDRDITVLSVYAAG